MTRTADRPAHALRLLVAAATALTLTVALLPAADAHAGNSGYTDCLIGYNYADASSGYLFASTDAVDAWCAWVNVNIYNPGTMTGSGFQRVRCFGTYVASGEGSWYATTSAVVDPGSLSTPCSNHYGAPSRGMRFHDWGALPFLL